MNFIVEKNRVFLKDESDHLLAEVTFPLVKEGVVEINHTFVDQSLRGQGVAGELMQTVAGYLRESNLKANLTCSYAIRWFKNNKEYLDVVNR